MFIVCQEITMSIKKNHCEHTTLAMYTNLHANVQIKSFQVPSLELSWSSLCFLLTPTIYHAQIEESKFPIYSSTTYRKLFYTLSNIMHVLTHTYSTSNPVPRKQKNNTQILIPLPWKFLQKEGFQIKFTKFEGLKGFCMQCCINNILDPIFLEFP